VWNNKFWRFIPATLTTAGKTVNPTYTTASTAICRAPLNSSCILFKSTLTYGGEPVEDEYIFR